MPLSTEESAVQRLMEIIKPTEEMVCPRTSFARTPAESFTRRCLFPATFLLAHTVVAHALLKMARAGDRNVGKLTLFLLGAIELIMFWVYLPTALGAVESFYSVETFRRFFHAATPITGSVLNILSGCDTFLTLLVCYEFRLVAENAKARALVSSVRRQFAVYVAIVIVSVAVSAFTFGASWTPVWRCGGARMDVRPVFLISPELLRAGQYLFALVVIVIPCALLAHTNAKLARHVGYFTLPTETNELIAGSKPDASLIKLRRLLLALTVAFVLPHVLSLAPMFMTPPTVSVFTMLSAMSISNWMVFASRVICYTLLHKVSAHLAKMGVVHVY
ncbi:hypothetical protein PRIPAC_86136 [Pristionchus pacificus]|uniref:Uncharacterized protein n=1 Tax=Pristionchus pacificus TaxID=54126 RepID=A0A2A6BMZ6_PRIPA|nr:hypothetical protein PRIPAC_86136 [Pristionchus pacificus]|eukprot:PDM67285.1 hypothetical protein PRIPAC_48702 [Pristionchus pacificus]